MIYIVNSTLFATPEDFPRISEEIFKSRVEPINGEDGKSISNEIKAEALELHWKLVMNSLSGLLFLQQHPMGPSLFSRGHNSPTFDKNAPF